MYPEITVAGKAGAGKSTAARILAEEFGAPTIEYADELKRFCVRVFGFTTEQLWGPSEARNADDPRYTQGSEGWDLAYTRLRHEMAVGWLDSAMTGRLHDWYLGLPPTLSPRVALQTLGSWGRLHDPSVWVRMAQRASAAVLEGGCVYSAAEGVVARPEQRSPMFTVLCGSRYSNEVLATLRAGGMAILVVDVTPGAKGLESTHSSETSLASIPPSWWSAIIGNNKQNGLRQLRQNVSLAVERWRGLTLHKT